MALTELTNKNLKATGKVYRIADGGGLTLEISATGSKLWRLWISSPRYQQERSTSGFYREML